MEFRLLKASEIDVRVGSVSQKGATLLLYKDARCDMAILDETVGPMNWQRHHSRDNANCTVALWDNEKSQWVEKEDTGTESFTEKEKGLASDSFKRACFNVGIGRELYTAPRIFIKCQTQKKSNGKGFELSDPFQFYGVEVSDIGYKDRIISKLVITKDGQTIYSYDNGKAQSQTLKSDVKEEPKAEKRQRKTDRTKGELIDDIVKLAEVKEKKISEICSMVGVKELADLEEVRLEKCLEWLRGE